MILTQDEQDILDGAHGKTLQKIMRTLVRYGEALDAERLIDIEWSGHFSIPLALPGIGPRLETLDELTSAGLKTKYPFTLDPKPPTDFDALGVSGEQKDLFLKMLGDQPAYDEHMLKLGLRDRDAYTCTPYFSEIGNIPAQGTILAWSESSCVVYANSVLGARSNRNSSIIDLLSNIIGKTPLTGFLTEEGRFADWLIDVRTKQRPHPQMLGAAIGAKVMEDVPYIRGLDRFLNPELDHTSRDFLKEMGAACAAIGAVGLFHVENITPEAIAKGSGLLKPSHKTVTIDDRDLEELFASYPLMWANKQAKPQKCMIGCPHLSLEELYWWFENINDALISKEKTRVAVETILFAAPQIIEQFKQDTQAFNRLQSIGLKMADTCPEVYMNNPISAQEAIVTNSNKFRAFTTAKMYFDQDLIQVIVDGNIN